MIQCQICQVTNDESAQFCRECGGRLQTAAPLQPSAATTHTESEPQEVAAHVDPPKRQRLHSPILGGGGGNDDDIDPPAPSFQRVKSGQGNPGGSGSNPSLSQGRRGLRSPLLGGDGDEMDEPDVAPRGKSGFGGFGGGKQKKTEFPHRHHEAEENHEQSQNPNAGSGSGSGSGPGAIGGQKSTGARGLRSPLLGGGAGDGDYAGGYEGDNPRASGKQSKSGRLRSPILGGGGGGDDYYEDEIFDDQVEEINDPTVLRSPLLAARSPKHSNAGASMQGTPAMSNQNIPVGGPKAAPFVQGPYTQASAGNAPNFAASSPPMPQAQPDPANAQGGPNFAAFPPNQGNQIGIIPQAPNQAPAYTPPPAPPAPAPAMPPANPEQYSYGVPASAGQNPNLSAQNMTPPNYQAPMPKPPMPQQTGNSLNGMPRPNQQALPSADRSNDRPNDSNNRSNNLNSSTGTGMEPAVDEAAPKARGMRGSKLLGDVSDDPIGPLDRRARFADRRGTSRGTGHGMSAVDDDEDDDQSFSKGNRGGSNNFGAPGSGGANPMAPILMALAVVALIAKGYYMSTYMGNPNLFTTALPATIDQLTSMLVLVGIILFALKAAQKS